MENLMNIASGSFSRRSRSSWLFTAALVALVAKTPASAGASDDADLAQELTNPIADLMTIPIQMNFDHNIGPGDNGAKITTNVQPVIPFDISEDWNPITRTIMPVIYQDDIFPGEGSQFGLGDINLTLFFSPKQPSAGGLTWGVGPVFLLPTATDSLLGGEKWGAGPAAIGLVLKGPWTIGILANHIWSFAGDDDRPDINNTFMQPFAAYTWPSAWTASLQTEPSYNRETEQWSVPGQCGAVEAGHVRQAAGKPARRDRLLGRVPRQRPGGLPFPAAGEYRAAKVAVDPETLLT
jgi:hypothetical protein